MPILRQLEANARGNRKERVWPVAGIIAAAVGMAVLMIYIACRFAALPGQ
jgi:hypothetical protein